jgi:hypothetical protein
MTRWMHPPELDRTREPEPFDPIVQGARYGLLSELLLSIWQRARADATDSAGRCDIEQAQRRFHELAARAGRLHPDVGRVTRVGSEIDVDPRVARSLDELRSHAPGRETLVAVESRRWMISDEGSISGEAADGPTEQSSLPGIGEVARVMTAMEAPPRSAQGSGRGDQMSRLFGFGLARLGPRDGEHGPPGPAPQDEPRIGRPPGILERDTRLTVEAKRRNGTGTDVPAHLFTAPARPAPSVAVMRSAERAEVAPDAAELVARARRDGAPLDDSLRPQLEASLGAKLGHVRVHTGGDADAAAQALGARAFAIGPDLFFRNGAYAPASREGQHLIAHEVAHAVQAQGAAVPSAEGLAVSQPGDAREREADAFADRFVRAPERGEANTPPSRAAPPAARDAGTAQFAIREHAASISLAREGAPGASTPGPKPNARQPGARMPAPVPSPRPATTLPPAAVASSTPGASPTPGATRAPAPGSVPQPAATPTPGASPPSASTRAPTPGTVPQPAATPTAGTTSAGPGAGPGATASASVDFAARIQTAVAAQRQAVTAKANEVKGTLATAFTGERQKLITGFDQLLTRMEAARDKAFADLATRGEAAKTRVRNAAIAERAKLEQALGRQQQAVRQAGDTVAQAAIQQATAQGDRVQQGAASRASRARSIGSQWASKFEALDGGTGTASDIRFKANDLASKIEGGASAGRQTCFDHGQKIASDLRKDAGDVATGMSDKLKDARSRIDKDRDDAITSIDDGIKGARDGITKSFAQTRHQVDQKKGDAGTGYDQLRAGALAQLDAGLQQVLGKLDTVGQQMHSDVNSMVEGAKQYAVAPEVTVELNAGIGRTVAQHETKLGQLGTHGTSAFAGVQTDASAAATQQTSTILGGVDGALTGLTTSLTGKVDQSAAKVDEAATSAVTDMQALTPKAEGDLQQGVAKGEGEWGKQLTEKIGTLSGRVDSILSQQDSQLSKLDSDLGSQYSDAKQKSDDAKRDKPWYESAWDAVSGAVSSVFEFVGGLIVGFFEAAWELLKGLWEMLKTPLGWLLLAIVVILAVIVVVLFGWEALIIAGIVIGLCMAAYYVYLAVTTPGLSPYERGKLFGKALFNVVLGFAGVEFEGSNLLRFTQWGGLIPQAIRLVQEVGSIGEAIQLIRAVGSISAALQLIKAAGGVAELMELAQAAGGMAKLLELAQAAGGITKLLELAQAAGGMAKLLELAQATGGIAKLLELAQAVGGIAKLMELAQSVGGMAKLLELAQAAGGITKLVELAQAAGGMAKLLELAQAAGGITKLVELAKAAGGLDKLLELATAVGGMDKLLELAKTVGGMAKLAELTKATGGIDKLLELAKAAGGMDKLLEAAKAAGGIDELLAMARETGGFDKLLQLAKEVGGFDKLVAMAKDISVAKAREFLDVLKGGERIKDPAKELETLINEFKTSERIERVFELARDAAHGNKISLKTIQEARVGLELEAKGVLQPPITRYPGEAAEFLDGNKVPWDVKGFFSGSGKGAFRLVDDLAKVGDELAKGENVIVDTTKMNAKDIADLRAAITAKGWDARVRWYP